MWTGVGRVHDPVQIDSVLLSSREGFLVRRHAQIPVFYWPHRRGATAAPTVEGRTEV
jgi:hypothetical protein